MTTTPEALQTAVRCHQAGRLSEAAEIYRQILSSDPRHAEAMHLLGLVAHQSGQHDKAVELITAAIQLDGRKSSFHNSLAEAYRSLGQPAEAKACCIAAIRLDPKAPLLYYNLALVHQIEGDAQSAAALCRQAIALKPDYAEAERLLAAASLALGDTAGARASYERLLALVPGDFDAHIRLGGIHAAGGQWPAAIACYEQAARLDMRSALAEMHLATALQADEQLDSAVNHYRRTIELQFDHVMAHYNLGTALESLGRRDEAALEYEATLKLDPTFADAQLNLGAWYHESGDFRQALAHFSSALAVDPNCERAHFNRALIWLTQGNLAAGWPEYEWRRKVPGFAVRSFDAPDWNGREAPDKTVLIHSEQGLGDTLQFIRYALIVRRLCGRVVTLVHPPLVRLLRHSGLGEIVGDERDLPRFDFQAPMMSLSGLLGTTLENIPAEIPYLAADPELVDVWRNRLCEIDGFRVGICWQGSATHKGDAQRSIPLAEFAPLAGIPGVFLVSLQKREGEEQVPRLAGRFKVHELGNDWDESAGAFMDTAAVLANLDLVITADTAVAHLAGALGVPVWVALGQRHDWRWLVDRPDTAWYPTMRLLRQSEPDDWAELFVRMAERLRDAVASKRNPCE